jgi:SPP1 family predicted phage head-tail adaptor
MIEKLRHRLEVQAPVFTQNQSSETIKSWQNQFSLWGSVRAIAGTEETIGEGESPLTRYQVVIRYRTDITPEMRFVYDQHILNIKAVLDKQGRKKYLTCICEESRND